MSELLFNELRGSRPARFLFVLPRARTVMDGRQGRAFHWFGRYLLGPPKALCFLNNADLSTASRFRRWLCLLAKPMDLAVTVETNRFADRYLEARRAFVCVQRFKRVRLQAVTDSVRAAAPPLRVFY